MAHLGLSPHFALAQDRLAMGMLAGMLHTGTYVPGHNITWKKLAITVKIDIVTYSLGQGM